MTKQGKKTLTRAIEIQKENWGWEIIKLLFRWKGHTFNKYLKAIWTVVLSSKEESLKKNYEDKVRNVENVLNNWHNKRLTLSCKIAVVKALAASQMVYVMTSMSSCLKSLKEVNYLIFKLLWDYKRDKIKRTEMIADYQEGGFLSIFLMTAILSGNVLFFYFYLSKFGGKLVFTVI